jgi:hypothetical protein
MTRLGSFVLAAAASLALLAAPAMAQNSSMGNMGGDKGMTMPKGKTMAKKSMAKKSMGKTTMKMASKRTCMDYAWMSQDQKSCEAGKIKPPNWR